MVHRRCPNLLEFQAREHSRDERPAAKRAYDEAKEVYRNVLNETK